MLVGHTEGLPEDLTRLSTTGLLRDREPRLIERWIESACAAGLIAVSEDRSARAEVPVDHRELEKWADRCYVNPSPARR